MIKDEELFGEFVVRVEGDLVESMNDLLERGGTEARADQGNTEGIDIATPGDTVEEGGFDEGGATAHKRVVNDFAGGGEPLDEEAGKLRLEAGAVGDFVEFVGLALLGGPEFVDVDRDGDGLAVEIDDVGFELACGGAEFSERRQLFR